MDFWVQSFYAASQDFGHSRVIADVDYIDAISAQMLGRSASAENFEVFAHQALREFDDAGFIRYRNESEALHLMGGGPSLGGGCGFLTLIVIFWLVLIPLASVAVRMYVVVLSGFTSTVP